MIMILQFIVQGMVYVINPKRICMINVSAYLRYSRCHGSTELFTYVEKYGEQCCRKIGEKFLCKIEILKKISWRKKIDMDSIVVCVGGAKLKLLEFDKSHPLKDSSLSYCLY